MPTQNPKKFSVYYKPTRLERWRFWIWGMRCDVYNCKNRAAGRYALAQEFGTVTGDLCASCLKEKEKRIALSEWGQYEQKIAKNIRGLEFLVKDTWKVTLAKYAPSWGGRVLLWCRLDK